MSENDNFDLLLKEGMKNYIHAGYIEWFMAWAFGVRRIVQSEGYQIKYYYRNGKYYVADIKEIK